MSAEAPGLESSLAPTARLWLQLRDNASAIRMAVQILAGPLHPRATNNPDPERVHAVLDTLEHATRTLVDLVAQLQPPANGPAPTPLRPGSPFAGAAPEVTASPERDTAELVVTATARVSPTPIWDGSPTRPIPSAPAIGLESADPVDVPVPRARDKTLRGPPRQAPKPERPTASRRAEPPAQSTGPCCELDPLLQQLAVGVATGCGGHGRLNVSAPAQLTVVGDGQQLERLLMGLIADAMAAGPTPGPEVALRAWLDPVEELGDDMDVVFEIRPDARAGAFAPQGGSGWEQAVAAGVRVQARDQGRGACVTLRVSLASS